MSGFWSEATEATEATEPTKKNQLPQWAQWALTQDPTTVSYLPTVSYLSYKVTQLQGVHPVTV